LFDKLARNGALGNAQFIGAAMHHTGVLSGADVAHQDVGNTALEVAIVGQSGVGWHCDLAAGGA
jgi:hypothetical protein